MKRNEALRWLACCLALRLHPILPYWLIRRIYDGFCSPIFAILNKTIDASPTLWRMTKGESMRTILEEYARKVRQAADDVWEFGRALGASGHHDLAREAKQEADRLHDLARKVEAEARVEAKKESEPDV